MTLSAELSKPEHQGKDLKELFLELSARTIPQVGTIEGKDLRDVVSILASGLQERLDYAEDLTTDHRSVRIALRVGFSNMSISEYGFNLTDPKVSGMLDAGVALGLVTEDERSEFYRIATKQVPEFPGLTLREVVGIVRPWLMDGQWHELPETDGRTLTLTLNARTPEVTHIVVQMQDLSGEWEHATALHGIQSCKPYSAPLPYHGRPRAIRWRCDYALAGVVAVL